MSAEKINVEAKVLSKNDAFAEENRRFLHEREIKTLNFISSPGSGKTRLLEKTLDMLKGRIPCAVIVGDQQSDNDAKRLVGRGAPVRQIETGHTCHLDAERVAPFLSAVLVPNTKILFIENVGNMICPAAFDLGEDIKVALLSVTEGEDKPIKYPSLFSVVQVVLVTKCDLIPHLDWSKEACLSNLKKVATRARIFTISAQSGEGMDEWVGYLEGLASRP